MKMKDRGSSIGARLKDLKQNPEISPLQLPVQKYPRVPTRIGVQDLLPLDYS